MGRISTKDVPGAPKKGRKVQPICVPTMPKSNIQLTNTIERAPPVTKKRSQCHILTCVGGVLCTMIPDNLGGGVRGMAILIATLAIGTGAVAVTLLLARRRHKRGY